MSKIGNCHACGATIRWVRLAPKFKPHPVDPAPSKHGTIHADDKHRATILPRDALEKARAQGIELLVSHFATCPDAARMRRPTTPIPEPASPVRTLVLTPEQASRVTPVPGPRGRTRVEPLTEGQVEYLEAVRAADAVKPNGQTTFGAVAADKPAPVLAVACDRCADTDESVKLLSEALADMDRRLTALATAAGYDGPRDFDRLAEHIGKLRASAITPDESQLLGKLEHNEKALRNLLERARGELAALKADAEQIGGPWLRELRALRAEYAAASPLPASRAAVAALRELALRMGYRLRE